MTFLSFGILRDSGKCFKSSRVRHGRLEATSTILNLKVCFEAENDSMKGKAMTFINFREPNETPFKIRR